MVQILSLDGGGSWSVLQAHALAELYGANASGHDILRHFRLVAATSGGSIVLSLLALNHSPQAIIDMFHDVTFLTRAFHGKYALWLRQRLRVVPRYHTRSKAELFKEVLGAERSMEPLTHGDRKTDFLVIAFDYDQRRAKFFRSDVKSASASSKKTKSLWALAVHASTNAPVSYFDRPAYDPAGSFGLRRRYWDGAITGHNNPVLIAVTEALANGQRYGIESAADLAVLSIGTGMVVKPPGRGCREDRFVQPRTRHGLIPDLQRMALAILDDPPDAASYIAHITTGGTLPGPAGHASQPGTNDRIVRLSPLLSPQFKDGRWQQQDPWRPHDFEQLTDLDMDLTDVADIRRLDQLAQHWLADECFNQPIRYRLASDAGGQGLSPQIGFSRYSGARGHWTRLTRGGQAPAGPAIA